MKIVQKAFPFFALALMVFMPGNAVALSKEQKKVFDRGVYYYNVEQSTSNQSCSYSFTTTAPPTGATPFNPDPAAVQIFNNELQPKIERLAPLYQKAAEAEGLKDWELLPALHYLEFGLQKTNPKSNLSFKGPFQMSGNTLDQGGVDPNSSLFAPGKELSDDEFVTQARYAIKFFIKGKAAHFKIDVAQPLDATSVAKIIVAYKSGQGSVWFTGGADFNLHAYAWAGYDTTPEHKLPMHYGPGSPYGDEQTSDRLNKPGASTTFGILKGGSFGSGACAGSGTYSPVQFAGKDDLVNRILSNTAIKWGNFGSATTQKQDIANCLTEKTLIAFLAMAEQSGTSIPVNALATDHGGCGPGDSNHNAGRAIDIGYYGNGDKRHTEEGDKLYAYLYQNYKALGLVELIWKYPPSGMKCIGRNGPVDCNAYYPSAIHQHYHHIHIGIAP